MTDEPSGTPTWTAHVIEVDDTAFSAELTREGAPGLIANFDRALLPDVQPGDLLTVTPTGVTRIDLGRWTQEELDEVRRRAREMAATLEGLAE